MSINRETIAKLNSLREQAKQSEVQRADEAKARAEENRRRMPTVTAWVDEARGVFGDVKVVFASENGSSMGAPSPEGVRMSETVVGSFVSGNKR